MRKAFNFYASFDDTLSELNDKQFNEFIRTLLDVQFFRKHIEKVEFKDKMVELLWKANKHSIKSQLEGFCSKKKIAYNSLFVEVLNAPKQGGSQGGSVQEKGQEKGQGQGKGERGKGIIDEQVHRVCVPTKGEIMEMWNENAKMLNIPLVKYISKARYDKFKVRLKHDESFLDNFLKALEMARQSDFIMQGTWFSFDWLIANDENYLKVLEGNYSGRKK